jgi:chromosome segregation ATPase
MRRFIVLAPPFLLFLAGCAQEANHSPSKPRPADTSTEVTPEQKEAYRKQAREELDRLEAEWNKMKARAEAAGAEVRERMQPTLDALKQEAEAARRRLQELGENTAAAWQRARPDLDRALDSLREAFRKAADQFK